MRRLEAGGTGGGNEEVGGWRLEAGGTGGGNEEAGGWRLEGLVEGMRRLEAGGWRDWWSTGYHVCRNCVMQKILLGEEEVSTVYIL